jgi:hypothetical protein
MGQSRAAFIVHEFHSSKLDRRKLMRNSSALQEFINSIWGWEQMTVSPGVMLPPITLPGAGRIRKDIPLSFGRVVARLQ